MHKEIGSYIAYHIEEKKAMLVYSINFSGYPTPEIKSVTVLKPDNSDYYEYLIEEVILYKMI